MYIVYLMCIISQLIYSYIHLSLSLYIYIYIHLSLYIYRERDIGLLPVDLAQAAQLAGLQPRELCIYY